MTSPVKTRRDFLKSSSSVLGASWLVVNAPLILAGSQSAHAKMEAQANFDNLTAQEGVELAAIVDQIIPADETPGAAQTGVVYFIDVALGGFMSGAAATLHAGLADLQQKVMSTGEKDKQFSELSFERQTAVLKTVEDTQFFGTLHFLTMMGMFCLPKYGGNRDHAGWDLLGFDHQHAWQPPFGYYDAAARGPSPKQGDDHDQS